MDHETRLKRWIDWLAGPPAGETGGGQIWNDVLNLQVDRQYFGNFFDLWGDAPQDVRHRNDAFMRWVGRMYLQRLGIGLRRSLDRRQDVASLGRLLDEMSRFPALIDRGFVFRRTSNDPNETLVREDVWRQFSLPDGQILDPTVPATDLEQLLELTEPVRRWVNKQIAHRDARPPEPPEISKDQMETMVSEVSERFRRYRLLVLDVDTGPEPYVPVWSFSFVTPQRELP